MARPSKLTPEVRERIVAVLRSGAYVQQAAEAAGIGRSTFDDWMRRGESEAEKDAPYRELREAVEQARAEAEARHVALIAKASARSWQAAAWLLERQYPDRWGKPSDRNRASAEVKHQGSGFFDELATKRQAKRARGS